MNKIAFLTTIFPIQKNYLKDFFNSLLNQTIKEFDLVVVNDGYKNFDLIKNEYSQLKIIEINGLSNIAKNREIGINYCVENNYDFLIFGDSDDCFQNNRIEKCLDYLINFDIVVNDLSLFDNNSIYNENYISNRVINKEIIDINFIRNKNIFGLSNTAIKLKEISKFDIPDNLIAVDWYLFSILLLNNKKAIFTNETITFYRQHQENIVGFKKLDELSFNKGINVKKKHYEALLKIDNTFELELKRLLNLKFNDKNKIKSPLWWELI